MEGDYAPFLNERAVGVEVLLHALVPVDTVDEEKIYFFLSQSVFDSGNCLLLVRLS